MTEVNTVDLRERIAVCNDFTPEERNFILVMLGSPTGVKVQAGTNYLGQIEALWAALSIDEGGEGICAAPLGGMTLPLIAADMRRLKDIGPIVQQVATMFGKPVQIVKFSKREVLEIFQP